MHGPIATMIFGTCFIHYVLMGQTMGGASPFLLLSHDTHRENDDDYDNDCNEHHTSEYY